MTRGSVPARVPVTAVLAVLLASGLVALQQRPASSESWTTVWSTSQQTLGSTTITNATVRMIVRVRGSGESVRIRLDNTFGTSPLVIGTAYLGQRMRGATLTPGSNRQVFFNRSASVTLPPGGSVQSDPVAMPVLARQDLAVSLYVPGADVRPSQHGQALVTSYVSANSSGDVAADETRTPFTGTTTSLFWLKAIDVVSSSSMGTIVAFGDSITDGSCSTLDAHDRWEDWLAVRLALDDTSGDGMHKAIVNAGIGGNTATRWPSPTGWVPRAW